MYGQEYLEWKERDDALSPFRQHLLEQEQIQKTLANNVVTALTELHITTDKAEKAGLRVRLINSTWNYGYLGVSIRSKDDTQSLLCVHDVTTEVDQ